MSAVDARAAVALARKIAEIIEPPDVPREVAPTSYLAWENLMMHAADSIAAATGYNQRVLEAAVGPDLEVGVNPPWRVLLMIARLASRAYARSHTGAVPGDGPVLVRAMA